MSQASDEEVQPLEITQTRSFTDEDVTTDSDDEPLATVAQRSKPKWSKTTHFEPILKNFSRQADDDGCSTNKSKKPTDYVSCYVDEELFQLMSDCTNITAVAKVVEICYRAELKLRDFLASPYSCHAWDIQGLECTGKDLYRCHSLQKQCQGIDTSSFITI